MEKILIKENTFQIFKTTLKTKMIKWFKTFIDDFQKLLLIIVIAEIAYVISLYFYNGLWNVYIEMPIGKSYLKNNPQSARHIFRILNDNFFLLSFNLGFVALKICLSIGIICHLFSLKRFLFDNLGDISRALFWGIVCGLISAYEIMSFLKVSLPISFFFIIIPCVIIINQCINFLGHIIPEIIPSIFSLTKALLRFIEIDEQ
ncbi:MAG: hypothetical protein HQK76_07090 [Desulfobacterales bacterium]|nr:hypothetical protein [Desulfobacterales bacterium]